VRRHDGVRGSGEPGLYGAGGDDGGRGEAAGAMDADAAPSLPRSKKRLSSPTSAAREKQRGSAALHLDSVVVPLPAEEKQGSTPPDLHRPCPLLLPRAGTVAPLLPPPAESSRRVAAVDPEAAAA
jgi:hypothetical protein